MPVKKPTKLKKSPKATKGTPSTQKYLDIAEIKEGTVIMKDGTLRAVLMVASINFALKSQDEQNAMVQSYMQFLNSFDFPLQIVIQSRKLDVDKYLAALEKKEKAQTNDLLRLQMADYRQYIQELIELADIMSKKFFVVLPYDPAADQKKNFFTKLTSAISSKGALKLKNKQFQERKHFLDQRVSNISNGLVGMGLNTVRLDTQGLIELYYNVYNPDVGPQQKMVDLEQLQVSE